MDTVPVSNICVCTLNTYDGFILGKLYTAFKNVDVYLQKVCDSNIYLPVCVYLYFSIEFIMPEVSSKGPKNNKYHVMLPSYPPLLPVWLTGMRQGLGHPPNRVCHNAALVSRRFAPVHWKSRTGVAVCRYNVFVLWDIDMLLVECVVLWSLMMYYLYMLWCYDSGSVHIHVDNMD